MANDLVKSGDAGLPGLGAVDTEAGKIVRRLFEAITVERGESMLPALPDKETRRRLEIRGQDLHRQLRPVAEAMTDEDSAVKALSEMFTGFPSLRNSNAVEMAVSYMLHLRELPLFAIRAACVDIIKGKTKADPDWAPTTPRLYETALKHVVPLAAEKNMIGAVLRISKVAPPPLSPEQREAMGKKLQILAEDLDALNEKRDAKRKSERAEEGLQLSEDLILREYRQRGFAPVVASDGMLISPSLAAQIGALRKSGENPIDTSDEER